MSITDNRPYVMKNPTEHKCFIFISVIPCFASFNFASGDICEYERPMEGAMMREHFVIFVNTSRYLFCELALQTNNKSTDYLPNTSNTRDIIWKHHDVHVASWKRIQWKVFYHEATWRLFSGITKKSVSDYVESMTTIVFHAGFFLSEWGLVNNGVTIIITIHT